MISQGRGAIVNVSSIWGLVGAPGVAAYQASKGAVTLMTKNASATWAAQGIRINSVHPGLITTPMTDRQDQAISAELVAKTPMGRPGRADEVADAITYLASDGASYITGAQLVVDGGFTNV
jgi:NAD(P)-dependent dehydrogenase (short-subunit alcohol dehydrogenase family)